MFFCILAGRNRSFIKYERNRFAFRDTAAVCPLSRKFYCEYGVCEKRGKFGSSLNHGQACPDQSAETQRVYGEVGRLLGGYVMIRLLEVCSFLLSWGYAFVFYQILRSFLPLRKKLILKIIAFFVCGYLADTIIYSNDLGGLLGTMLAFFVYVLLFYKGTFMEKISLILVFYPALISVNYLMLDVGGRLFKLATNATFEETLQDERLMLISTLFHTVSLLLRLLFWIAAWLILRKFLSKLPSHLNVRTWMIIDMLMLASFVAIFTIIYFMPENTAIVYPICGAAIFSSFGCMYLASYIYDSMQTAYRLRYVESQQDYYRRRVADEERIRSIYHDMKNHLLVLEGNQGTQVTRQMAQELRSQIADYENYIHTGNDFLDIIIRDKAEKAHEKHIDFSAFIDFGGIDFIEPLDISTLFGNGIDNAIEASEKLPDEQRVILVKAGQVQNFVSILIENNCSDEVHTEGHTTKADKFLHGFGISNMKKAAEKYGGTCTTTQENGKFTLKILLPVK